MGAVGGIVEQAHAWRGTNRGHQCFDHFRTAPLADVGDRFDDRHGLFYHGHEPWRRAIIGRLLQSGMTATSLAA
jgi:hypothetical protein